MPYSINSIQEFRIKPKDLKEMRPFNWIQAKEDGYRLTLTQDDERHSCAWTSSENIEEKLRSLSWWQEFTNSTLPLTIVDGELFLPGKPATEVVTALNEYPDKLVFRAFAVPYLNGDHNPDLIDALRDLKIALPSINQVETWTGEEFFPKNILVSIQSLEEKARSLKIEGWVLKENHYSNWWKIKPQKTADVVVTGWYCGKESGQFADVMGGVTIGLYEDGILKPMGNCGGGFDEELREELTEEDVVGKVIEIEYQSLAAKGRLQFSRFIRFRDDKLPHECLMSQVKG